MSRTLHSRRLRAVVVRRRWRAVVALLLYAQALWWVPLSHASHHLRFGVDHVHTASGLIGVADDDLGSVHAAQHAVLGDLGLDEVASAGTLAVDCSLAALTLVECPATAHAPSFADALLAHHHPAPHTPDLEHGRGSFAHGLAALLVPTTQTLPVPSLMLAVEATQLAEDQHDCTFRHPPASRGPPG